MASHDSATAAISKFKAAKTKDKADAKELKKDLKAAAKSAKTVSSTKKVKSAIKEAVIKASGNAKIAEPRLADEFDKEAHKHSGPLYHAIQRIADAPFTNGLNAETTAGIAMANQILHASSGAIDNGMNRLSMTSRKMPPGITPSGFLDDEADE